MSTNVQVSNARRVGFTAMAVVLFIVLAYRGYWSASERVYEGMTTLVDRSGWRRMDEVFVSFPKDAARSPSLSDLVVDALGLAVVPFLFLVISVSNRPPLRAPWLWASGLCIFTSMFIEVHTGDADAWACLVYSEGEGDVHSLSRSSLHDRQIVSWLWLLLPIILTTAFVIYAAWRRAVRDRALAT